MSMVNNQTSPPGTSEAPAPEAAGAGGSPRDRQRDALRDLMALATQCAATEARIEQQHQSATEQAQTQFQEAQRAINQTFGMQGHTAAQEHVRRLEQNTAAHQAASTQARESHAQALRRVEREHAPTEQKARQQLKEATWLADSELEVAQNQMREEAKRVQEVLKAHGEALDGVQEGGTRQLVRYGQQAVPTLPEPAAVLPEPSQPQLPEAATSQESAARDAGASEAIVSEAAPDGTSPAAEAAVPPDATPEPLFNSGESEAAMAAQVEKARQNFDQFRRLFLPKLVVGPLPWLALLCVAAAAAATPELIAHTTRVNPESSGIAGACAVVVFVALWLLLRKTANRKVHEAYAPLNQALADGRRLAKQYAEQSARAREEYYAAAVKKRDRQLQRLKQNAAVLFKSIQEKRENAVKLATGSFEESAAQVEVNRQRAADETAQWLETQRSALTQGKAAELEAAQQKYEQAISASQRAYDDARVALQERLRSGLAQIEAPLGGHADGPDARAAAGDAAASVAGIINNAGDGNGQADGHWSEERWARWMPSQNFPSLLRFGEMSVDLKAIAGAQGGAGDGQLELPPAFSVPAALAFPRGASMLVQYDRGGRERAIGLIQTIMVRLLTMLPPARVRFTIFDPVGLGQNFAGFMRLADHDENLVGSRIWTETEQIEKKLADMTEHMETVIQKYLRNEFATIDQYNAQAGELAEPYRFVVVADFPAAFRGDAFRRLTTIADTGARCGVYVLVARDLRAPMPSEAPIDDLAAHCINLIETDQQFVWQDEVFGQFPLSLDAPPPERLLAPLLERVGKAAKESKRVEVSFDNIAPTPEQFWTRQSNDELAVPIGRMGATRLQMFRLGRGVAQHALVAGKTGSGKSTLLHAIVSNLAMWYSPDQIELYLIDFKKGVEFQAYATHMLPHARAIAVESDREFGLSVLERLDAELGRRGELYRAAGVQDLAGYRKSPGALPAPRILLMIDEFQEFFSEDDRVAQEATLLLDRLVRQGRAFGIHLMLGSQTIAGASGLARSTLGQMAVRVALQTSEADSHLILGDNNSAARLLSRPGEAIYNDAGGLVEGNSPFQVAWLPDEKREFYLDLVQRKARETGDRHAPPIVFQGNAAAELNVNQKLAALLRGPRPAVAPVAPIAWVGEPVAIKPPTGLVLRRQSGANVLLVGQQEEQPLAAMLAALISLAAQFPNAGAVFHVLDGAPAGSTLSGLFDRMRPQIPQELTVVEWRSIAEVIDALAQDVARRQEAQAADQPEIFLFIYGLQRYRMLRKSDDDFSFSGGGDDKPSPPKQFAAILRDGPGVGVHVITWIDTSASIERTLDRTAVREFDHRILFQMSAADSSALIDSPAANKLGLYRALAYSEEQGVMEKFRPYGLPSVEWLKDAWGKNSPAQPLESPEGAARA